MPTAFQLVETSFPQPDNKNTEQKIDGIYDYLFILLEQLRYTLFNLDTSNMNSAALDGFLQNITEPIYAQIEDSEGRINQLGVTAAGLQARMSSAEGSITTLTATANGLQTQVNGKIGSAQAQTLIDQSLNSITLAATSGESGTVFKISYDGAVLASTGSVDLCVDAVNIYGTLTAQKLQGSVINVLDDDGYRCGRIYATYASSADTKIEIDSDAVEIAGDEGSVFLGSYWSSRQYGASVEVDGVNGEVQIKGDLIPNKGSYYNLGTSSFPWGTIYADTDAIGTSDRKRKTDIEDVPEKYLRMLEKIAPKRYRLINGTSGRYHTGFIAQEVEAAMRSCGVSTQEFAGFVREGSHYGLRYAEFIPLLLMALRAQGERIKRLEERENG